MKLWGAKCHANWVKEQFGVLGKKRVNLKRGGTQRVSPIMQSLLELWRNSSDGEKGRMR